MWYGKLCNPWNVARRLWQGVWKCPVWVVQTSEHVDVWPRNLCRACTSEETSFDIWGYDSSDCRIKLTKRAKQKFGVWQKLWHIFATLQFSANLPSPVTGRQKSKGVCLVSSFMNWRLVSAFISLSHTCVLLATLTALNLYTGRLHVLWYAFPVARILIVNAKRYVTLIVFLKLVFSLLTARPTRYTRLSSLRLAI